MSKSAPAPTTLSHCCTASQLICTLSTTSHWKTPQMLYRHRYANLILGRHEGSARISAALPNAADAMGTTAGQGLQRATIRLLARSFTWWHRRPRAGRPPAQLTVSTSGTPATSTEQLRLYTTARDRSKCETALDVGHKALPTDGIPRHGTSRRQFTHRRFLPLSTGLLRWSKFFIIKGICCEKDGGCSVV